MAKEQGTGDCRKCGKHVSWMGEAQVELCAGAAVTVLCAGCRDKFHEYIRDEPTWKAFTANGDEMQMIYSRTAGDGIDRIEEIRTLREKEQEIKKALRGVCQSWLTA